MSAVMNGNAHRAVDVLGALLGIVAEPETGAALADHRIRDR
jgi:hypothetical protein